MAPRNVSSLVVTKRRKRICTIGSKDKGSHGDHTLIPMRVYGPVLERRAKLGCVSRGQNPASEALARHRVPSVASAKVTTSTKRTQGGDGPQCASVKG